MLRYLRYHSLDFACLLVLLGVFFFADGSGSAILWAGVGAVSVSLLLIALSFVPFTRALAAYRRTIFVSAFLAIVCLLCCYRVASKNERAMELTQNDLPHTITAYCTEPSSEGTFGNMTATVTSLDGRKCDFKISLLRVNAEAPKPYTYFEAEVIFEKEFEKDLYKQADNIIKDATASSITETNKKVKGISAYFYSVGNKIESLLDKSLSKESKALASALLLGRREGLSDGLKRDFRTLGISHLLAVSGMHLSILCAALLYLLGKCRVGLFGRLFVCTLFILIYCGLCGFVSSVLRAALMTFCVLVGHVVGQRMAGQRALLLSVCTILLCRPYLIFDVALQLSALSTLGILTLFPILTKKEGEAHPVKTILRKLLFFPFALSLAAVVFTLPVIYARFGNISLVSPLANLLFVPLFTLLMYMLPVCLLLCCISPLAPYAAYPIQLLCRFIIKLSQMAYRCKDLYCHIPTFLPIVMAIVLLVAVILYRYRVRYSGVLSTLLLFCVLLLAYPLSLSNESTVLYRYDTERESILVRNENHVVFVETGNGSRTNAYTALRACNETLGQTGIDLVILTHYHSSQSNFLAYLLENTYLECVFLKSPENEVEVEYADRFFYLCQKYNVTCRYYKEDVPLSIYDFTFLMHNEELSRSTHPAQGIAVSHKNMRILFADPALFELDGLGAVDLSGIDHLVLLQSPPVDKYPLPAFPNSQGVHAIYTSKEQMDILGVPFASYTTLTKKENSVLFTFGS